MDGWMEMEVQERDGFFFDGDGLKKQSGLEIMYLSSWLG